MIFKVCWNHKMFFSQQQIFIFIHRSFIYSAVNRLYAEYLGVPAGGASFLLLWFYVYVLTTVLNQN